MRTGSRVQAARLTLQLTDFVRPRVLLGFGLMGAIVLLRIFAHLPR